MRTTLAFTGLLLSILIRTGLNAQSSFVLELDKPGHTWCTSIAMSEDGNFTIAGHTDGQYSDSTGMLLQVNQYGALNWNGSINLDGADLHDIKATNDGGYIATGVSYILSQNTYKQDLLLVKFNENGQMEWHKEYGLNSDQPKRGYAVLALNDGYLVCGEDDGSGYDYRTFLLKTDLDGNKIWDKDAQLGQRIEYSDAIYIYPSMGGAIYNGVYEIDTAGNILRSIGNLYYVHKGCAYADSSGICILSEVTVGHSDDPVQHDIMTIRLQKVDWNGLILFTDTIGAPDTKSSIQGQWLRPTPDGGFAIVALQSTYGLNQYYITHQLQLIKLSAERKLQWIHRFSSEDEYAANLLITDYGYVFATTRYGYNFFPVIYSVVDPDYHLTPVPGLIYPNPAGEEIAIDVSEFATIGYSIELITVQGKRSLLQGQSHTEKAVLDISGLVAGMYFVHIYNAEKSSVIKLMVE